MTKNMLIRIIALTMAFAMVMAMTGCTQKGADPTSPSQMPESAYSIQVTNRAGDGMNKIAVEVFTDESKATRLFKGITNENGEVVFTAPVSIDYVAVVSRVPLGYAPESHYKVSGGKTKIVVNPGVMDEAFIESMMPKGDDAGKHFVLGNAMPDFELTLPDNSVILLSDLLKTKKAVVLNFWFMNCAPCRGEFPYIQEGYEQVKDDVAVLALNPIDGTAAEIAQFQADNGYTFTMSKCDTRWQEMMQLMAFPTTVVIDRYSNICLIHTGELRGTQDFLNMVNYFISDDYEQEFFRSLGQIPKA